MKPEGYENSLGLYGPQIFDSFCGEPIGWGFKILERLGDDKFNKLRTFGSLECIYPSWFLITKHLTREDAIEKYGSITAEERGPRGGFRSDTYGTKRFANKLLRAN